MWLARNLPAFLPCFSRHCRRFSLTSCMPTVICVGRSSFRGVGVYMGSRIMGTSEIRGFEDPSLSYKRSARNRFTGMRWASGRFTGCKSVPQCGHPFPYNLAYLHGNLRNFVHPFTPEGALDICGVLRR